MNDYNPCPIVIFTFNRIETLKQTIKNLQRCDLAIDSDLFIFSDAPRGTDDINEILKVRSFIKSISGFKKIEYYFAEKNLGLAKSIIEGVTKVMETNDSVIVLEDDLIASKNFLTFMNQSLNTYKSNPKIISISGYSPPIKVHNDYKYDNYFTLRSSSWGWATWKEKWRKIDWTPSDYKTFLTSSASKRKFNKMGSDMSSLLSKQVKGKINSWAIRFCYHQFKNDLYTVYPTVSKIQNIGFGADATHTSGHGKRFKTILDTGYKQNFKLNPIVSLEKRFMKQFLIQFSLKVRLYYKIRNFLRI